MQPLTCIYSCTVHEHEQIAHVNQQVCLPKRLHPPLCSNTQQSTEKVNNRAWLTNEHCLGIHDTTSGESTPVNGWRVQILTSLSGVNFQPGAKSKEQTCCCSGPSLDGWRRVVELRAGTYPWQSLCVIVSAMWDYNTFCTLASPDSQKQI